MRGRSLETISERRRIRLETVLHRRQPDLRLVLENVWDPHNVSAMLRTADAVGIQTVHLLYYIEEPPNLLRKGKQSSASAKKWLDFRVHRSVDECVSELRREGFQIFASHLTDHAATLHELDFSVPTAIIMGNEHRGVSEEICAQSDAVFHIPMMGMVESLNVSVAAAVTMYEALRQRHEAGLYGTPRLSALEIRQHLETWAKR